MTRQDYEAIAAILRREREAVWPNAATAITAIALEIARYAQETDKRFHPSEFLDLSGVIR